MAQDIDTPGSSPDNALNEAGMLNVVNQAKGLISQGKSQEALTFLQQYGWQIGEDGQPRPPTFWEVWKWPIIIGAIAGTAGLYSAFAGAGAVGGSAGGGAAASTGALTGGGTAAVTGGTLASTTIAPTLGTLAGGAASGAVPAALGTSATAGAGMSIPWGDIIRYGVQEGGNYLISRNAANASKDASQAQIDAVNRAIALQEKMYNQGYADVQQARGGLSPYQALGTSAMPNLYRAAGIPQPTAAPSPTSALTNPNAGLPPPDYGAGRRVGTPSGSMDTGVNAVPRMVTIQAPTGETRQVQASQSQFYISRGGKVVG